MFGTVQKWIVDAPREVEAEEQAIELCLANDPGEVPLEEHLTEVGGCSMYSLQAGAGHPLILLHGLLGAAACWRTAMIALARGARVYAVDAIGIGRSARVKGLDGSLRAAAERLRAFMDKEGIESADICATSHGGAVAMFFAATYPARVKSLILQAPANPFCSKSRPQIGLFCSRIGRWLAYWVPWAPRMLQSIALHRMYGDPKLAGPKALDPYIESLRVPGTVAYVLSVLRCWTDDMAQLKRMLKRLQGLPCLLLWGTHDRAVSLASAHALRKAIGSELAMMEGLGHVPYEERPLEFAERVVGFLASVHGESGAIVAGL